MTFLRLALWCPLMSGNILGQFRQAHGSGLHFEFTNDINVSFLIVGLVSRVSETHGYRILDL